MRRLMIILLSVCLLSVLLLPAAATDSDADCVISVGSASAFVGNTVEIPVYLTNNPGFAGASLEFSYDTSVLKLTRISKGELLEEATGNFTVTVDPDFTFTTNVQKGRAVWIGFTNTMGDGELLRLTFDVLNRDAYTETTVSASLERGIPSSFCNIKEAIPVKFEDGSVACRVGKILLDSEADTSAEGRVLLNLKDAPKEAVKTAVAYYAADGKFLNVAFGEANLDRGENVLTYTPNAKAAMTKIMLTDAVFNPLSEALVIE